MNKQHSIKIGINHTHTRSRKPNICIFKDRTILHCNAWPTYGLSGKLSDLRHTRPMYSQRIIFKSSDGIPSINSTITDDSGNFRVSGLRAPMRECYYNHRALYGGGPGYNP